MRLRSLGACVVGVLALTGCRTTGTSGERPSSKVEDGSASHSQAVPGGGTTTSSRPSRSAPTNPVPVWPPGIFTDKEAPIGSVTFRSTGRWVGAVHGVSVALYAGRDGRHPLTGAVMLVRADHGRPSGILRLRNTGPLTVKAADGSVVTLVDSVGVLHYFDASTGSWVAD